MSGLITVIVPCFNYGHYLEQCVRSLQAQSYRQWKCIIVDDGSTDETPRLCERLAQADPRVSFVRQLNAGLSAARNTGIGRAEGDVVQLLDADDLLEPDKFAVQMRYLAANAEDDIVLGDAVFFECAASGALTTSSHGPGPRNFIDGKLSSSALLAALVRGNICAVNAPLVRRRVFERIGLFDQSLRAHEDWDFWIRCAMGNCRFAFLSAGQDRALVRRHGVNMSGDREKMLKTAITVRERVRAYRLPPSLNAQNEEHLAELKWRCGLDLIVAGKVREGSRLYIAGLSASRKRLWVLAHLLLLLPGVAPLARLRIRLRSNERGSRDTE